MELDDIERLVREKLALTGDFAVSKRLVDRNYLSLTITAPVAAGNIGARQGRVLVRIWTDGAEAFFLELDERFNLKEFDWELEGQADIIRRMTRLAKELVAGIALPPGRRFEADRRTVREALGSTGLASALDREVAQLLDRSDEVQPARRGARTIHSSTVGRVGRGSRPATVDRCRPWGDPVKWTASRAVGARSGGAGRHQVAPAQGGSVAGLFSRRGPGRAVWVACGVVGGPGGGFLG